MLPNRNILDLTPFAFSKTFYVYGLGLLHEETSTTLRYYHPDRRGDTVALTDGTGTVTDRASYGVYGEILARNGTTNTPFLFNGKWGVQTDGNGLNHHRARYYHPLLRRFLNQDTILGSITDSASLNRFAYANGNPVSLIDPFGLMAGDAPISPAGSTTQIQTRIYVWDSNVPVDPGHIMTTNTGTPRVSYTSSYPHSFNSSTSYGSYGQNDNVKLSFTETLAQTGGKPDYIFLATLPNSRDFHVAVADINGRPDWSLTPTTSSETNCGNGACFVLNAGGLPMQSGATNTPHDYLLQLLNYVNNPDTLKGTGASISQEWPPKK